MNNLQVIPSTPVELVLTQDDIETLVSANVIPQGVPPAVVKLFARFCADSKLSPFKRQVHLVGPRKGKFTIQTGIDGYRAIADRTGRYAGNDDPIFDNEQTPRRATVTVHKLIGGQRCPFTATARWDEYAPSESPGDFMWKKMPHLMLAKCAESLALRKAFPDELGGIYTDEEMQQADAPKSVTEVLQNTPGTSQDAPQQEFDPKVEIVSFGKHKGKKWAEVPSDYLEFLTRGDRPNDLAQKTLDALAMDQEQTSWANETFGEGKVEIGRAATDGLLNQINDATTAKAMSEIAQKVVDAKDAGDITEVQVTTIREAFNVKSQALKAKK